MKTRCCLQGQRGSFCIDIFVELFAAWGCSGPLTRLWFCWFFVNNSVYQGKPVISFFVVSQLHLFYLFGVLIKGSNYMLIIITFILWSKKSYGLLKILLLKNIWYFHTSTNFQTSSYQVLASQEPERCSGAGTAPRQVCPRCIIPFYLGMSVYISLKEPCLGPWKQKQVNKPFHPNLSLPFQVSTHLTANLRPLTHQGLYSPLRELLAASHPAQYWQLTSAKDQSSPHLDWFILLLLLLFFPLPCLG